MSSEWDLHKELVKDYDNRYDYDGVSGDRLARRLHLLSEIGLTDDGGSMRIGFSQEEKQAKELAIEWMKEAGLSISKDGAGNIFGRLEGKDPEKPAVLSGSHLDSVPNGGHFDGPLGVLSALEVVEAWKAKGYQPGVPYEVVIFSDEEGARFNSGLTGSRAMTGTADIELQGELTDQEGKSFEEVMNGIGLSSETFAGAVRNLEEIETFVEVHIEQGKRLEQNNLPVGIVEGIAGPSWLEFDFIGAAGHAGNTPMTERQDALVAAGEFIRNIYDLPKEYSESAVATVGKLNVYPNGINVIPGKVALNVDVRDIFEETRNQLIERIEKEAARISKEFGVEYRFRQTLKVDPVPIPDHLKEKLGQALEQHSIEPMELPSGAGHDALIVGHYLPVAMLFVNSKDGVSHTPEEWSSLNDCVQGVHVLKSYIESLT